MHHRIAHLRIFSKWINSTTSLSRGSDHRHATVSVSLNLSRDTLLLLHSMLQWIISEVYTQTFKMTSDTINSRTTSSFERIKKLMQHANVFLQFFVERLHTLHRAIVRLNAFYSSYERAPDDTLTIQLTYTAWATLTFEVIFLFTLVRYTPHISMI